MQRQWQFWIDRGGTFTDIVARRPGGGMVTHKLLSEAPERYADAAVQGIHDLLGLADDEPIPEHAIAAIKMGTTVATNALLERRGARTLFVTTRGFGDVLRIGYQNRPRLFDLDVRLPEALYERVIEIDERIGANGMVHAALDLEQARQALLPARAEGIESVAICLMHAWRFPAHEQALAGLCSELGFTQVSVSHQASPLMKIVGRGDTTVADAYLSPVLRRYVDRIAGQVGSANLLFMQSNGGLAEAGRFQGKDAILSGPAGGVVGAVRTAALAGFGRIIGFDMGGTSTDVCHFDGEYERVTDSVVAGTRIRAPMMYIHTVAAGGGSVLHYDAGRFRTGPDSAGADPGPACYGRGGPLTVTDCNVLLGKVRPERFPRVFGADGRQPLDMAAVRGKFAGYAAQAGDRSPEQVAEGFLQVAVETMARAIKRISLERGHDVSRYTLVCFGGAGGQHACMVADALGMTRVMIHPLAGVLSALGMGLAEARELRQETVEKPLSAETLAALESVFRRLGDHAVPAVAPLAERTETLCRLHLRYAGTDTSLEVAFGDLDTVLAAFEEAHRRRFGFSDSGKPLIVEAVTLEAVGHMPQPETRHAAAATDAPAREQERIEVFFAGAWRPTLLLDRAALAPGRMVEGPAIIAEAHGTNVVEPGWRAVVTERGDLILDRAEAAVRRAPIGTEADPVQLEIFNNLFMSIAEQMGVVIENTSHSVNMKERLDFSCALFDAEGGLIANAPHIPVHLGSMGDSVRTVMRENPEMAPGDVFVTNAPYNGGTHLPDITVVTPVFVDGAPLFYTATRGHHADVGGITPGSVPPGSTSIEQEGVLLDNVRLVSGGHFLETGIRGLLAGGTWPARNPDQNVADLKAQVAANAKGAAELLAMIDRFGLDVVRAYMSHVQDNAEEAVRQVIDVLPDGSFRVEMDCGAVIAVSIAVDRDRRAATVDFTGTSPQQANNFNAPMAITRAATLYAFRCLVADDIPLNEGCLKPLTLIVPEGSLLNPRYPAAVVAGNVETSQCVVNALFGALGAAAAAQGTMNNLTFGNDHYQYYETLAGGMGAGPGFDGASAVQTHMTNSRLTDPEVLEFRFPVTLDSFSVRDDSGGQGRWRGGDGVIRRLRFHEAMTAGILSNNRSHVPFGLAGGHAGKSGVNRVERASGACETLPACAETAVGPGDVLVVETPGGGGYGTSA
ncbi:hydantoinase B/oxoprolinase family protein [Emcibacter sp. SYSU 3D8]|uniref:hydantoinase B/oxoprolinase family protein n=1 Tax=Emcibacter sp. SYSU 3D8 TaxID=3133969 RepID=UPI0031FE7825